MIVSDVAAPRRINFLKDKLVEGISRWIEDARNTKKKEYTKSAYSKIDLKGDRRMGGKMERMK
jgi:hypothetical protein